MARLFWLFPVLAALSSASVAEPSSNYVFVCQLDDSIRRVEVTYLLADQKVPCEVQYKKDDEDVKVLWRADNQEGFCESRAQHFIKRHTDWGFDCVGDDMTPRSTASSLY